MPKRRFAAGKIPRMYHSHFIPHLMVGYYARDMLN